MLVRYPDDTSICNRQWAVLGLSNAPHFEHCCFITIINLSVVMTQVFAIVRPQHNCLSCSLKKFPVLVSCFIVLASFESLKLMLLSCLAPRNS